MSIRFEYINAWGVITLQKVQSLNALDLQMVLDLRAFLRSALNRSNLKGVLIKSDVPNIFCAGGDIKAVYHWHHNNNQDALSRYVQEEYGLNQDIYFFPKPVVAIIDGLTLGGGVGLSRYASYRIATDRAIIGMPEVKIAFFPDIGAGYFLNMLKPPLARFLALTGYTLQGSDLQRTGYVTHLISYSTLESTIQDILRVHPEEIEDILPLSLTLDSRLEELWFIVECFKHKTLIECVEALYKCIHPEAQRLYKEILTFSPLSLHIIWRYLELTRGLNYSDVVQIDLKLAQSMLLSSDFIEGIRVRLIDKQAVPKWRYHTLNDVPDVSTYFETAV
jgi:enoyl-CoA hydratase/carnithine racemase